ncbi:MAG: rod shape-determining protein MreC [Thermovirgaceae bacterium]
MKPEASKALHGVITVAVGLLLIAFLSGNPAVYRVMDITEAVLSWPEFPAAATRAGVQRVVSWFADTSRLQEEIGELRKENLHLRQIVQQSLLDVPSSAEEPNVLPAMVTLRRPVDWWKEIKIDKGSTDEVEEGMAVLQNGFLAGRVSGVSGGSSRVELLTSPSLMIPAVVEKTRDLGVIAGDGEGGIRLLYVPLENLLSPGMQLSSTLVSEHLAPGLPIGEVGEPVGTVGGYRVYSVVPGAEFSRLYRVQVCVQKEGSQ